MDQSPDDGKVVYAARYWIRYHLVVVGIMRFLHAVAIAIGITIHYLPPALLDDYYDGKLIFIIAILSSYVLESLVVSLDGLFLIYWIRSKLFKRLRMNNNEEDFHIVRDVTTYLKLAICYALFMFAIAILSSCERLTGYHLNSEVLIAANVFSLLYDCGINGWLQYMKPGKRQKPALVECE